MGEMVYSIAWCSPIQTVLNPPASAIWVSSVRFATNSRWETDSSQRSMWTNREKRITYSLLFRRSHLACGSQLRMTNGSATGSSLVLIQTLLSRVYSLIVSWPCSTPTPLLLKPWRGDIGDIAR